MEKKKDSACFVEDYGFEMIEKVLLMISGKWKIQILYHLGRFPQLRYGELKRKIPEITHKILSSQLKDLEKNGLVSRKEYPAIPPKVEYRLTNLGVSLLPIYEVFGDWCEGNREVLQAKMNHSDFVRNKLV